MTYMTIAEASRYLNSRVARRTLQTWAKNKRFPHAKFEGGRWLIPQGDLDVVKEKQELSLKAMKEQMPQFSNAIGAM